MCERVRKIETGWQIKRNRHSFRRDSQRKKNYRYGQSEREKLRKSFAKRDSQKVCDRESVRKIGTRKEHRS